MLMFSLVLAKTVEASVQSKASNYSSSHCILRHHTLAAKTKEEEEEKDRKGKGEGEEGDRGEEGGGGRKSRRGGRGGQEKESFSFKNAFFYFLRFYLFI